MKAIAILLSALCAATAPAFSRQKPNILFVLADDLGWCDAGCYGSRFHETPHIDRLAARGVKYTQAYSASPLCSPTRASILTGLHPARIGMTFAIIDTEERLVKRLLPANLPRDAASGDYTTTVETRVLNADSSTVMPPDVFTLAECFRENGYATAHFGKWHVGAGQGHEPGHRGFDLEFPRAPHAPGPAGGFFAPWKFIPGGLEGPPGQHIDDRLAIEAETFIHEHKGRPFFLNFWMYSVHAPFNARQQDIDDFSTRVNPNNPQRNPLYAAMVKHMDDSIGRLLRALDDAGVADNTIIIFTSDNGGFVSPAQSTDPAGYERPAMTSCHPLRRGKGSLYEGGTRVPLIVVWPGVSQPGSISDAMFQSSDFYPTLLTMCGLKPRDGQAFDGVDQSGTVKGLPSRRDRIFCHYPHGGRSLAGLEYSRKTGYIPGTYVREGDWKLIRFFGDNEDGSDRLELYNLKEDIGETNNLAAIHPARAEELNRLMDGFLLATEAVIPKLNPDFQPVSSPSVEPQPRFDARGAKVKAEDGWQRDGRNLLTNFNNMYNPCVVETEGAYRYKMWFFGWAAAISNPDWPGCDAIFHARSNDLTTWEVYSGNAMWDATMNPKLWAPVLHAGEHWYEAWHVGDPSVAVKDGKFHMAYSATSKPFAPTSGYPSGMVQCIMGATSGDGIHWEKTGRPLLIRQEDNPSPRPEPDRIGDFHRPCLRREGGVWKLWFDYWVPGKGVCLGLAENNGDFASGSGFALRHDPAEPLLANWPNPEMVRIGQRWHSFSDPAGYPAPPDTRADAAPWVGRQLREAVSNDGIRWQRLDFISPDADAPACHVPQALMTGRAGRTWLYLFYATQKGSRPNDGRYHYEYDGIRAMRREITP